MHEILMCQSGLKLENQGTEHSLLVSRSEPG